MAALLRSLRLRRPGLRVAPVSVVGSRQYSSVKSETRLEKLKAFARKHWDDLDPRAKGAVYDAIGRSVPVVISGGWGILYFRTLWERQDRIEERQAKINKKGEKAICELKQQVSNIETSVSRYREESETKHKMLETELAELRYLRDLWMCTAFQESSKTKTEAKGNE